MSITGTVPPTVERPISPPVELDEVVAEVASEAEVDIRVSDHAGLPNVHHPRSHDHSLAADGSPIAVAGLPNLTSGKVWQGNVGNRPVEVDPPGVPSGLIAMWHGLIANIPSGWVICDGNNGTPNLLARFVEGVATAATNPGATGGATAKTTQSGGGGTLSQWSSPGYSTGDHTHRITDIRPKYYDVAFIMKT